MLICLFYMEHNAWNAPPAYQIYLWMSLRQPLQVAVDSEDDTKKQHELEIPINGYILLNRRNKVTGKLILYSEFYALFV